MTCSEDGCRNKPYRRGLCQTHYRSQANPRFHSRAWQERFWEKVQRAGPDECWLWTGYLVDGYGGLRFPSGNRYAHRLSWELHFGSIPEGMTVDHHWDAGCRSRACVNPNHLRLLTRAENSSEAALRQWARQRGEA